MARAMMGDAHERMRSDGGHGEATAEAEAEATFSEAAVRPIAFLQHGLFGTSARWTLGPPDKVD